MTDPHPNDPLAYQEWVNQLEQKWQAGLIPDPQAVAIIVLNDQGEVLLQLRDSDPNIAFANFWTLPGGVVAANETTEEAARRELLEETGLSSDLAHWKFYRRESKNRKFLIEQHIYTCQTQQDISEMVLGEGQALQFFKQEELPGLSIAYGFDELLNEFFEHSKGAG